MKLITTQLALLATTAFMVSAAQASITINSSDIKAVARVFTALDIKSFSGTGVPTPPQGLNAATSNSGAFWSAYTSSQNTIQFSENNGQTTLLITINNHESGGSVAGLTYAGMFAGAGSNAINEVGDAISFTVTENMTYELSGLYQLTGTQTVRQVAKLVDVGTGAVLFSNDQTSSSTLNEAFTLGEMGGDQTNILEGNLTGQLLAGHTYAWSFGARLDYTSYSPLPSSADGYFKLVLNESTDTGVVPEATSFLTWGLLGLTGAVIASSRRKRRSSV